MKKLLFVLALMFTTTSVMAFGIPDFTGPPGPQGEQGIPGVDGADGADGMDGYDGAAGIDGVDGADGLAGISGTDGLDGSGFDSSALDFGLASASALANIPDDVGSGNSTLIGVGMGFYNSTDAVALGVVHQFSQNWIGKASVAQSLTKQGDDNGVHALWGVGGAYRF